MQILQGSTQQPGFWSAFIVYTECCDLEGVKKVNSCHYLFKVMWISLLDPMSAETRWFAQENPFPVLPVDTTYEICTSNTVNAHVEFALCNARKTFWEND